MSKIITISLLLLAVILNGQNELTKVDSIFKSKIEVNDPGLMLGIVKDGDIIYENYRGLANLQHKVKVNEKTRSNIASTAKQFTALMVLDLSLKGKLNLDDDLRKYFPNLYPDVKEEIKIRHLLNHTSGIRDYVELLSLQNKTWWQQFGLENDDIIALLENQKEVAFKPGSQYVYSNSGYVVLAELIANITGQKFTDYSKQFFEDLGMHNTSFAVKYMGVIENRAEPYADWGSGAWFETPTVTKTSGEGFLFTSLKDQLVYEQMLQRSDAKNQTLLQTSQKSIANSEITDYGFGLELKDILGRNAIYHSGATYGYQSHMLRFPDEGLSIFLISNNGNIRTDLIAEEVALVFLTKLEQSENYDQNLYVGSTIVDKAKLIGQYTYPNGEKLVEIVSEEGQLYWREANFTLAMNKENQNNFAFDYDPSLKVKFYPNKMVEFYASGKTMTYAKSNLESASVYDMEGLLGTYISEELEMNFKLSFDDQKELTMSFDNGRKERKVKMLNKNFYRAGNISLRLTRDRFDRGTAFLLNLGRATNISFKKKTELKAQNKIATENGSIQVTTIGSKKGDGSDILLTKNLPNGNEIWSKRFGGSSYDKASSIISTDDGYLIIGSTSSYGEGNYDMFVIKTDKEGKKIWQNTYGEFYNEYGYSAEKTETGFIIKGSIQKCTSNSDVLDRTCISNVWFVEIDSRGKEISREVLESII